MTDSRIWEALALRLEAGRDAGVPVVGASMHPFLRQGDHLHLRQIRADQLRLGDLMAFRKGDALIVHRFAGRVRREGVIWLRQKGDNVQGCTLVSPSELVGRAEVVVRGSRTWDLNRPRPWLRNRLLGCRAWLTCALWELARAGVRILGRRGKP